MRYLLALLALAMTSLASAVDVPQGVRHVPGDEATQAAARERLMQMASTTGRADLASMLNAAPLAGRMPVMLGTFATQEISAHDRFDASSVRGGNAKVPIASDVPTAFPILGASTDEQRAALAAYIANWLPAGVPDSVRPPTFEELARIWFFIGWDLTGPLLVAEWGQTHIAFDFDAAGERIEWMERLDQPCFPLQLDSMPVIECYCLGIERQDQKWTATYVPAATQTICRT